MFMTRGGCSGKIIPCPAGKSRTYMSPCSWRAGVLAIQTSKDCTAGGCARERISSLVRGKAARSSIGADWAKPGRNGASVSRHAASTRKTAVLETEYERIMLDQSSSPKAIRPAKSKLLTRMRAPSSSVVAGEMQKPRAVIL